MVNGKSISKWQNQKLKHTKQMENNCHIPVKDFSIKNVKILLINIMEEFKF